MKNDPPITNIASTQPDLYPHIKITGQQFPRALATRRVDHDDAEYFGAFLPKTATRILLDFVNRVFRLRTCDIPIDGNFPVPCTQYYRKRCLAPCVESICDSDRYLEMVGLLRLFLADQRGAMRKALRTKIRDNSHELDFEEAAYWRDILDDVEKYWSNPRWAVWLDTAVDTYEYEANDAGLTVFLVTQRGRHVVGRKVFNFSGGAPKAADQAIAEIVSAFYRTHAPKEIRLPVEIPGRKEIGAALTERSGHEVAIVVSRSQRRIASGRALINTRDESELDRIKPLPLPGEISRILRDQFKLSCPPRTVGAFDVAHISGEGFVAAMSVWRDERFVKEEYSFHLSQSPSELSALADEVSSALTARSDLDLIVLDGGRPQLSAVLKKVKETDRSCGLIAAVKPPGRHSAISRFLLADGTEVPFDANDPANSMLQLLRDDAHDLANRVHRDLRDMGHHYELAAILPGLSEKERRRLIGKLGSVKKLLAVDESELITLAGKEKAKKILSDLTAYRSSATSPTLPFVVPIRYDAEDGNAADMRPIATQ